MNKNTFSLAGHKFTLKNIQTCDFMSDETVCFQADLYCDGKFLCTCENDGHGGATFTHCTPETRDRYFAVLEEVGKEIWLKCNNGHLIYYDLGTVADEVLALISLNKEVAKLQKNALVMRRPKDYDGYDPDLYTRKIGTIKLFVQDAPGSLAKKIAEAQDDGWEVLNTNIPESIYEAAKEWRLPTDVKGRNAWRFPCNSEKK